MTWKVDLEVKTSFYRSFERVLGHNTWNNKHETVDWKRYQNR